MEVDQILNDQLIPVRELTRRFSQEVLARAKQFQDDLLVSCLQFIISLPSECVAEDFSDFVPSIQVEKSETFLFVKFRFFFSSL